MTAAPTNPPAPGAPVPTCGKCGYELKGVRPTAQGLVCPECATPLPKGPLTGEDYAQVEAARKRGKRIWKAARLATISAWMSAIIGGSALAFGIFDRTSAIAGGFLLTSAIIDFKGAARFRRVDLSAPLICSLNQLALLLAITAYCVWRLMTPSASISQMIGDPMGDAVIADVAGLESMLRHVLYGAVIAGSVLMQGLMILRYMLARRSMRKYLAETPPWVIELHRRSL